MYLSFYKLTEKPFNISSDPRFLWYGEKHREALANLTYGLMEGNGYVVLTGDAGTGKTTLVNALIETLDDNVLVAKINHPTFGASEFLYLIAKTYDSTVEIASKADCLFFFKSFLQRTYAEGKTVLLIIDEAHRLPMESLEEIRLLSNMEQDGKKLINIFLAGQNEFKLTLISPECHALRQRITLFYDIHPLSEGETRDYVVHRLKVAGTEEQLFTSGAIHQIQNFTRGYPRLINIICDRAMLTGYVKEQKEIDADIVSECSREISFLDLTAPKTDALKNDKFLRREPTSISGLSAPTVDLNDNVQGETPAERASYRAKNVKNDVSQKNTGSFVKKKRRKWIPTGLVAAIVFLAVAVGIGVKMRSKVKTDAPKHVDQTAFKEKAGVPARGAALAGPQQPTDNAESVSETPVPGTPQTAPPMLKRQPSEKNIGYTKENASANPVPAVVPSPSLGKMSSPEAKPKMQNKPTTTGSADLSPTKIVKAFQPTTLELATAALEKQNYETAIELLEADRLLDARDSIQAKKLYSKALVGRAVQIMKKSPSEAETMLRRAVEADPQNATAYFNLGKIHTQNKKYIPAIDAYQKTLALNPNFSDANFNLGFLYASTAKYKEAERLFARVVQLKPPYLDKALFNLALVQEKLGKKQESLANLKEAIAVKPDNQKIRAYLKQVESGVEESP